MRVSQSWCCSAQTITRHTQNVDRRLTVEHDVPECLWTTRGLGTCRVSRAKNVRIIIDWCTYEACLDAKKSKRFTHSSTLVDRLHGGVGSKYASQAGRQVGRAGRSHSCLAALVPTTEVSTTMSSPELLLRLHLHLPRQRSQLDLRGNPQKFYVSPMPTPCQEYQKSPCKIRNSSCGLHEGSVHRICASQ